MEIGRMQSKNRTVVFLDFYLQFFKYSNTMGCVGTKTEDKPQLNENNKKTEEGPSPQKQRYTNAELEKKRKDLQDSLTEGNSRPPAPHYPHLEPVSSIQQ